jgi:hypothetical protein
MNNGIYVGPDYTPGFRVLTLVAWVVKSNDVVAINLG